MSLQAYNAVWQHSTARGTDLLVLLALADFADEAGWSYPSIDALAKKARISQRATQDRLRALEAQAAIRIELQAGPHGTNRYQILGLRSLPTPQNLHPAEPAPPPQIRDGKRDEDLHPNRKESSGSSLRSRATTLPAGFIPDSTGVKVCFEQGLNLETELDRFTDHHIAKGSRMADWQAAWRTWCNRSKQFQPKAPKPPSEPPAYRRWTPETQEESLAAVEKLAGLR